MDTISSAYPPVAPPPAQGGSKTTMYVMVFFMCLISVVAGVMYTNFTKMQSEANAKAKAREELIKSKGKLGRSTGNGIEILGEPREGGNKLNIYI